MTVESLIGFNAHYPINFCPMCGEKLGDAS